MFSVFRSFSIFFSNKQVQHGKSATWKEKTVQHECNMKKVQHEKYATWNKCNIKKCNMEEVQHGKNATWKKLNKKIVEA